MVRAAGALVPVLLRCSSGVAGATPAEDLHTGYVTLYQHAKRPEWGFAIAFLHLEDRRIFLFESGERRAIMNEYAHLMAEVEPPDEQASKARQSLGKHAARATAVTPATNKTRSRKASTAADKTTSPGKASKASV